MAVRPMGGVHIIKGVVPPENWISGTKRARLKVTSVAPKRTCVFSSLWF